MPHLSGIYDSAPIQPIVRIKENMAIWTIGKWQFYTAEYIEPIPPGPATIVDMVTVAGVTTIAAGGTIAKRVVPVLQLNSGEMLQLRWEPLDYVEGVLWELAGQGRFASRNIHARTDPDTHLRDPYLSTTQFWIIELNRDMNLEARNPLGYAIPAARFIFWGIRYLVESLDIDEAISNYLDKTSPGLPSSERDSLKAGLKKSISSGDRQVVSNVIGPITWLPAEGRTS